MDNEKMREAMIAAAKIVANPHGYTETSVLVAEALIGQAAQSVPVDEDSVLTIANAYESGIGHCNDDLCNPYSKDSAGAMAYDIGKEFGKSRGLDKKVSVVARSITGGRWHHGSGTLCMGSLRIAREDFDTDPTQEVKTKIFDELCAVMNSAPTKEVV